MSSSTQPPSPPSQLQAATPNTSRPRIVNTAPRDRIDSILDGARARRLAMDSTSNSDTTSAPASPRAAILGHHRGENGYSHSLAHETESSADEETAIMRRGSRQGLNYRGTQTASARGVPSTASIRRSGRTAEPGQTTQSEEEEAGEHQGWWAGLLSEYGSIELENKGSVARDHLALERTFLAWLRTSLAFASIGIAITQLFRLNVTATGSGATDPYRHLRQMGKPLGATFLGISIVMLFVGFRRYFEGQHWIIRGKFPASRGSIALVAAITLALMVTSLVVVVVVEPSAFEKR